MTCSHFIELLMILTKYVFNLGVRLTEFSVTVESVTLRFYCIGKGAVLKQLRNSEDFSIQAEVFNNRLATAEEIATAGEKALVSFYSGSEGGDTLDQLRLQNSAKKYVLAPALFILRLCLQPLEQPDTSASESITKYRRGGV